MTEQQFEVFQECEYLEEWSSCPYCIKYDGETVFETLPLGIAKEVCKKLNEQQVIITALKEENEQLKNQNIEYEEVQCRIMNYIIDKGLGSEFAKFLRENM